MKRKMFFALLLTVPFLNANSQSLLDGSNAGDNWSVGIRGGGVTAFKHNALIRNMRPAVGVELSKQLTPVFGLGVEGMGYINVSKSRTIVDASNVSLLGKVNLMNLFGGYPGEPRVFEMEAVLGSGWLHSYVNGKGDDNFWSNKVGMNLNFNLGAAKAWTFALKPALVYNMDGDFNEHKSRFNANNAFLEMTAGLIYHFKNSNGKHHFGHAKPYSQAEIDALNGNINDLRRQLEAQNKEVASLNGKNKELNTLLDECRNKKPQVKKVVETATTRTLESVITFRQGRSTIETSQLPNVERIGTYMKKHKAAKVVIKGYASPEGSLEVNQRIALARAKAVKELLMKKYGIGSERILAEGQGVGNMFSEADWNRVSICTIEEAN